MPRLLVPLILAALAAAAVTSAARPQGSPPPSGGPRFTVVEATIAEMRAAMEQGRVSSREIVTQYLTRIATYEDKLHAAITVNPRALDTADERDRERAQGTIRGPLHGIPIALKDNIHTTDMPTTGGALAFDGLIPPYEATLTGHLRDAGAIIIAKTTLTELANWVAGAPTPMPTNYNSLRGQAFNPYDPRRDPREATFDGRAALATGGSSNGTGTSANFWAASVGTETSGSILSPANQNMLAAIKPTVGRISRYGIIPITADQDTAGPMAKSVSDAALLLGVLEGRGPDPNDPATRACTPPPGSDYTAFLNRDGLKGARIGIPRAYYYDRMPAPGSSPPASSGGIGGLTADERRAMDEAIAVLEAQGAVIVDPADIPSVVSRDPANNILAWNPCSGVGGRKGSDQECSVVFKYGMKRDFNAWIASLGAAAPLRSLSELRAWNTAHARAGTLKYGQSNLDNSDEMDVDRDRARYAADRAKDLRLAATEGIDAVMKAERLDAMLFPGTSGAGIAARPGYPTVMVPNALVPNTPAAPFPAGFDALPAPFGVSFTGMACSEPRLIEIAYAFEQATRRRVPPTLGP